MITKEGVFLDECSILLITFSDHARDGISKGFTINEP